MVPPGRRKIQKTVFLRSQPLYFSMSRFPLPASRFRPPLMPKSVNRSIIIPALALLLANGACTLDTDVTSPAGMAKSAGDQQTAPTNTVLPTNFQVIVVNQLGEPLKNVTVNWSITSGGGSISGTPTRTGDGGVTEITYTTGPTAGTATI